MAATTYVSRCSRPRALPSPEDVFDSYSRSAPLAHALHRAAEAGALLTADLEPPLLDLGCGAGEFARFALPQPVTVGLDISPGRLARAQQTGAYHDLCLADAARMPFPDDSFQTVLSVSVLEHLHRPEQVLSEVYRVLRPGGLFVGTVVLAEMYEHLCFPGLLRWLGLGRVYASLHRWAFSHRCLRSQSQWQRMFAAAGLDAVAARKVVSPRATWLHDLLLATAWPYRLLGRCGCHGVWRPGWLQKWARSTLLPVFAQHTTQGSSLFFVVRKREPQP